MQPTQSELIEWGYGVRYQGTFLVPHAPNKLQDVDLDWIAPSDNNHRRFIEREDTGRLFELYSAHARGESVVLPDPPVLRYHSSDEPLELLAGHRRVLTAVRAGVTSLPARVVQLDDAEAFRFIREANQWEGITTVEKAFDAWQMHLLGFTNDEILELMGSAASLGRYLAVGQWIDPEWFTDRNKCGVDPSITVWFEATKHGREHFEHCFRHWDAGHWSEEECQKFFRRRGEALPLDNNEKGLRLTTSKDGRQLKIRGTLNLDYYSEEELLTIYERFVADLRLKVIESVKNYDSTGFGVRSVQLYNPETVSQ